MTERPPPSAAPTTAPTPPSAPPELQEEGRVGETVAGWATNAALVSLSIAARCFRLYDPDNAAVRGFIEKYRDMMRMALDAHGAMDIEVRPFELVRDGEVVYLERDRERSLSLRLFRDGVRRLAIEPEVDWKELLRLLEVVSIRATGFRLEEDDLVTLLRKADFAHVRFVAVEGVVEEEEEEAAEGEERTAAQIRSDEVSVQAPHDWDLPLPAPLEPVAPAWQKIPEFALANLRADLADDQTPGLAVRLAFEMLRLAGNPRDPTRLSDVVPYLVEVRDYLLSESALGPMVLFMRALRAACIQFPEEAGPLIAWFGTAEGVRRLVDCVPAWEETPPPELLSLLEHTRQDPLPRLLDMLADEAEGARHALLLRLVRVKSQTRPDSLVLGLARRPPAVVADLLQVLAELDAAAGTAAALDLVDHSHPVVLMAVLAVFEKSEHSGHVSRAVLRMAENPHEDIRLGAFRLLGTLKDHRTFDPLTALAERRAALDLGPAEADALGSALAAIQADRAREVFATWIHPPGLLRRFLAVPGQQARDRVAVAGLARLAGDDALALIRHVADRAGEDLHAFCMAVLSERHRVGGSHERS